MNWKTKKVGTTLLIEIEGEIMGGTDADDFKDILFKAIEDDIVDIVVDMEKATWMNSSGLGMLISGLTTLRSSGGDLRLANVSERVRRPLEITKLDSVFSIYNSVEDAIKSY
ncbi:MAG: STAS domain-containing protein [candidate division KSB1 bacterium]|jgi:anti-sigma B factor antagonist|nr:STAS domain-containing protein [candidate division KSB1 bacterium]